MKDISKKMAVLSCAAIMAMSAGCSFSPFGGDDGEVGYVDKQLVLAANPNMKEAQKEMQSKYGELQAKMKEVSALPREEQKQAMDGYRKQMSKLQQESLRPVADSAKAAAENVMKKHGMKTVVDKNSVLAGGKDLTKEVLIEEGLSKEDAEKAIQGGVRALR